MCGRIYPSSWTVFSPISQENFHARTSFHFSTFLLDGASPGFL